MQAFIVVDLGFGDAGKGTTVDYLARLHGAHTVVRHNGGPQAAHNVVTSDGRHHTFAQFGSGTFVPGTRTHLSRFMLVDPISMMSEEKHLRMMGITDAFERITIDERAMVITPFQRAANRLREMARGDGRHGSCGMGVGETMADSLAHGTRVLFAGDLRTPATLEKKLRFLQDLKRAETQHFAHTLPVSEAVERELDLLYNADAVETCLRWFADVTSRGIIVDQASVQELYQSPGTLIFEGAQGVLLDEWFGFHPYTTWSTTTSANADTLLEEQDYEGRVVKVGVLRAFATRHGPGPFVTEDAGLTASLPDQHNELNDWQGGFRVGWFDGVAARYALAATGDIDYLAVTHMDRLKEIANWRICQSYQYAGEDSAWLPRYVYLNRDARTEIEGIKVHRPANLEHQERVTNLLKECQPRYRPVSSGVEEYLRAIEQELGVPVGIVSAGPTAEDKRLCLRNTFAPPLSRPLPVWVAGEAV